MTQPRLLADFAAVPTPRERRHARATNRAAQGDLFAEPIEHEHQAEACPVCASTEHAEHECPHGTAPTLPLTREHKGSRAIPARTLYRCDDATCPTRGTDVDRRDGGHYHDHDNSPERVAERRAMFINLGWSTTP